MLNNKTKKNKQECLTSSCTSGGLKGLHDCLSTDNSIFAAMGLLLPTVEAEKAYQVEGGQIVQTCRDPGRRAGVLICCLP